jgi:hypothetical protein
MESNCQGKWYIFGINFKIWYLLVFFNTRDGYYLSANPLPIFIVVCNFPTISNRSHSCEFIIL